MPLPRSVRQVDRLEGRRSVVLGGPDMGHSATVKKDDGKWKVDTSYIGRVTSLTHRAWC